MFIICGRFHEVSPTSLAPVVDIATLRVCFACCNLLCDRAAADLLVGSLNDVADLDTSPVPTGEIAASQILLNSILHFHGYPFVLEHQISFLES